MYCTKVYLVIYSLKYTAYFWKTKAKIHHQIRHHQLKINHKRTIQCQLINSIFPRVCIVKIPVLNVVSTRHRSHFLPNSSSLGRTGAILNLTWACSVVVQHFVCACGWWSTPSIATCVLFLSLFSHHAGGKKLRTVFTFFDV